MQQTSTGFGSELKLVAQEASRALATLDAERLEELANSCRALGRDLICAGPEDSREMARHAHDAIADIAIFARVLSATRANLQIMNRLRLLRQGPVEYGPDGLLLD